MASEQAEPPSKLGRARIVGFYLSVVAFLFMWVMIFSESLLRVFLVWFDASLVDTHVVHNVTFFSLIWVFGLAMLAQLYRPSNRVTAMQMALLLPFVALVDIVPQLVLGGFDPMLLVFFAPVFIAAALHPARAEVFSPKQFSIEGLNRPLLGLVGLALVPVGIYAAGQLSLQMTLADAHAEVNHYSSMAFYSSLFIVYAALASLGGQSRRPAIYGAAFMAILLTAISTPEPAVSSLSTLWSGAAVIWALGLVGTYEWSVRRTTSLRADVAVGEQVAVEEPLAAD